MPPVKVPPIVKPKPIETPKPQPKPQAKPIVIPIETPKPQPKPQAKPIVIPIETPKPQPKPEPKPETRIKSDVIKTDVGEISVVYEEQPPRKENRDDVAAGITNRVKYIAQLTPNILSVAPSAENIKESIANSVQNLNRFQNTFFGKSGIVTQFYKDHYAVAGHDELQDYLDRSPMDLNVILKLFDKYRALIEAGNAKPFLLDEFQDKYEEWFNNTKTFEYIPPVRGYGKEYLKVGHLWIAMHIDPNKFTELSDTLKKDLDKGFYIDKDNDNIYVDKNGKLNSYAVSPIFNAVVSEITRNNLEKRVFGSNSKWNRPADSIDLGNYPGWTKTDVTSTQEFAKYNVGYSDGIKIEKLTKEKDNPSKTQDGFLITIDVANKSGYEKSINFIKSLQDDNKTITGYRIKNIGRSGASQELKDVLAQLPKKLPLLELFFESFNTSSLIALEEKEIDELGLYTSQNSLVDEWSLNPWSLKGVAYVNMADYNVSASYNKYDRIFTRITFNSIGFDDKDWVSETDLTRINNGLRMVYFTRNNERIFQGGFGPGLNPDHNEGGNSYPTGLDLSRVTKAKGLKNMEFWDRTKGKGVNLRKLKRIVLYNESEIWETDTDNMNKAQFNYVLDKFVAPGVPKSKIIFSNRKNTKNIKITPKIKGHKLDNEGIANLSTLFNFSDGTFSQSNTIIYVPEGESQLYNQLKGLGYNTQYQAEGEEPIQLA
nr:putative immunoglobulin-blocking virulence protein [Mycoplasma leonicaptivi]